MYPACYPRCTQDLKTMVTENGQMTIINHILESCHLPRFRSFPITEIPYAQPRRSRLCSEKSHEIAALLLTFLPWLPVEARQPPQRDYDYGLTRRQEDVNM